MAAGKKFLVAVAIDFGTTFSGYAYQYCDQYERDKLKIDTTTWSDGKQSKTYKTPTVILMSKNSDDQLQFEEFGYLAENKYIELQREKKHTEYYYCRLFKMVLHNNEDIMGREVPALKVFQLSIKYLKDHFMRHITKSNPLLESADVMWMLTVPAIWDDKAKQFMRLAAEQSGIKRKQLTIVLEPEAACLYCRIVPVDVRKDDTGVNLRKISPGTTYMILDSGGGTVDITIHSIDSDGKLEEIHQATGGPWGGSTVNRNFYEFLGNIFGSKDIMKKLEKEHPRSFIELERQFEITKSNFDGIDVKKKINIRLPPKFIQLSEKLTGNDLDSLQIPKPYASKVWYSSDEQELTISADVFHGFFKTTIDKITRHVDSLMIRLSPTVIDYIFMVGGFSDSPVLHNIVKKVYKKAVVIVPNDPQIAVLKGAVLFGQDPKVVSVRIARKTYGTDLNSIFNPDIHPEDRAVVKEGVKRCRDVFSKFFTKNDKLTTGKETEPNEYSPVGANQTRILINIYCTEAFDPKFVDERGVEYLGKMEVEGIPKEGEGVRDVVVSVIPGNTELKVVAYRKCDMKKIQANFEFFAD